MSKKVITDEALFWSLVEAGVSVYAPEGVRYPEPCENTALLEARGSPPWLHEFRQIYLPKGLYYIETE